MTLSYRYYTSISAEEGNQGRGKKILYGYTSTVLYCYTIPWCISHLGI